MSSRPIEACEQRVLLLTPTPRDGELCRLMLAEAGVRADVCPNLSVLLTELASPVGAVIVTEESLTDDGMDVLQARIEAQPAWSDLPVLVLVRGGVSSTIAEAAVSRLGNVTLLERPLRIATLISTVRSALRGRMRQYQTREHLLERTRSHELLESRVAERTALAEQRAAQLRGLASELAEAEMRERRRLARVLHDHLQQLLVAARLSLRMALGRAEEPARASIQRADELLSETIEESRSLTVELSPPILYEGGLGPALAWLARWMGEKHALCVRVDADPSAEPQGEQARVMLFQGVRELLFNVVKHSGVSAAKVTVACDPRGGTLVRVSDRGSGFAPRADGSDGEHFGLFSIRERLEVLGGDFHVESAPGSGTTVTMYLPTAACGPVGAPPQHSPAFDTSHALDACGTRESDSPGGEAPRGGGLIEVLLADDHEMLRKGLIGLLDHEPDIRIVAEASDGREAVELAERLQPDVVVMDVTMPGLTGLEATRQIAQRVPGVRVIGLSMHSEHDMAAAMHAAGAAAYLTKGGSAAELVDCIKSVAAGARAAAGSR